MPPDGTLCTEAGYAGHAHTQTVFFVTVPRSYAAPDLLQC
jgi:hypothetical protein